MKDEIHEYHNLLSVVCALIEVPRIITVDHCVWIVSHVIGVLYPNPFQDTLMIIDKNGPVVSSSMFSSNMIAFQKVIVKSRQVLHPDPV